MTCPLFVELCAGTAALSLRLHHPRARPPVSRMGAKTGYADVILRCLGLYPGQGAADGTRYGWCEPDPGVRLLLHAYRDRALAMAAADIIRGWKDEEPRALWERLRAEGKAKCPPVDAREVARWAVVQARTYGQAVAFGPGGGTTYMEPAKDGGRFGPTAETLPGRLLTAPTLPATIADDARAVDPREVARNLLVGAWSFRQGQPESGFNRSEAIGHPESCKYPRDCVRISTDTESVPTLPATIADDARAVDPREVARWALLGQWSYRRGEPESGFKPSIADGQERTATANGCNPRNAGMEAALWDSAPTLPATIADDARTVPTPPRLPAGTVVYADPPYKNTTQYANLFPREQWLPVVRRWREAGALVCVSEAEPIPDLMAEGWHAVEITGERRGQKRTFGGTREWLTMSEPPRWRPSVQFTLFGAPVTHSTGRD